MGIGKAGAKNAGVLAARILGLEDKTLSSKLTAFKEGMRKEVDEKACRIENLNT
jgi:phosphoribosylcarboxyaminoimidazole (NCAIR) mutase